MYHQQSQAIVPLRGMRRTRLLAGAFAPEPHACFAGALVHRRQIASSILRVTHMRCTSQWQESGNCTCLAQAKISLLYTK
jgi:hypothetical protein